MAQQLMSDNKSQWCAIAVSAASRNMRTRRAEFCKRIELCLRQDKAELFPINRESTHCVDSIIHKSRVALPWIPSPPLPFLFSFCLPAFFSPSLLLSFLPFFLSPTVLNIPYVPGAKYSCMYQCPKRINGTFGMPCTAVIAPLSLSQNDPNVINQMTAPRLSPYLVFFYLF